jgi:hypothetical protein
VALAQPLIQVHSEPAAPAVGGQDFGRLARAQQRAAVDRVEVSAAEALG